jgi:hypothetical protein
VNIRAAALFGTGGMKVDLFSYLAAAGAGVAGAAAVSAGLEAFLFFFTCFLVVVVAVALLVAGVAAGDGACAAIDKPAVASASPNSTTGIVFMILYSFSFSARRLFSASVLIDERSINRA